MQSAENLPAEKVPARNSSEASTSRWSFLTRSRSGNGWIGLLILVAVLPYVGILANGFVYDDGQQILDNPYVKSWHYLPQILGTTVWSFVGAAGATNYYRPLMTFSFLLLWTIFGPLPFGFHLFSLLVHALVVVMVYSAGRRLFEDPRIAWLAALLFALHPVHTEAVDWIAALPDLEVTLFVLLSLWFFAKSGRLAGKTQLLLLAVYSLALLSKEPALMLVPLAIVFEHFVRPGSRTTAFQAKIFRYAPLCAFGIAYLFLRVILFGKVAPVLQRPSLTWPQAVYSAFSLISGYLRLLLWPSRLSAFHVFHASDSLAQPSAMAGVFIAAVSLLVIVFLRKKAPSAAFAVLWIGVTLAPVLNARWMASNVLAERYLYLPSVGFCWFVAWIVLQLWDGAHRHATSARLLRLALAIILGAAAVLAVAETIRRNGVWQNDLTLYTRTLETDPDAHIIRGNLAGVYFDRGDLGRAAKEWETSLAGKPDNVITMNALGIVYTQQGRLARAEEMLTRAIAAKPLWGAAHYNYGLLLQKKGETPAALKEFKLAVELSPLNAAARRFYGEALLTSGRLPEAEIQLKRAVELEPSLEALHDLSNLYLQEGQLGPAQEILRRAVTQFPYDSAAHFQLAQLLEGAGHIEEARREYEAGLLTDPSNGEAKTALQRLQK